MKGDYPRTTRRELFSQLAAVSAASLLSGDSSEAREAQKKLKVGVATLGFQGMSNVDLAKELASSGIKRIQFTLTQIDKSLWKYNQPVDLSSVTPAIAREVAAIYRDAGIEIHNLGVYANLIHPEEAERKANLTYFEAMMKIGQSMGVRTFSTESGHYFDPKAPMTRLSREFQDETWPLMIEMGQRLAEMAEKYDAKVLMEPSHWSFFSSAKRLRVYLEEVNSPRIRALLDPANIIEVNDLPEMFQQLAPMIDAMHAKDRKLHVQKGVAAGLGDLDYREFVSLAAKYTPDAPIFVEYVGLEDYQPALAILRRAMQDEGIGEA